jgi:hypothetical protein
MPVFTPSFECRSTYLRRYLGAALFGCTMLTACAQPAGPQSTTRPDTAGMKQSPSMNATAHGISTITLERDCNGCATGTRLELRREGQAVATTTGKAKLGTVDSVSRAPLPAAEFEALAQQLLARGFFDMAQMYEEAGVQDGSWATLTVVRGGVTRQVFRREDAGPATLKALEAHVAALQARLVFVPDAR